MVRSQQPSGGVGMGGQVLCELLRESTHTGAHCMAMPYQKEARTPSQQAQFWKHLLQVYEQCGPGCLYRCCP